MLVARDDDSNLRPWRTRHFLLAIYLQVLAEERDESISNLCLHPKEHNIEDCLSSLIDSVHGGPHFAIIVQL